MYDSTIIADTTLVPRFHQDFERVLPEIEAIPATELLPINLDVPSIVNTTLGALGEILEFRDAVATTLPQHDVAAFDNLGAYAAALRVAHTRWLNASKPAEPLPALAEQASKLRDVLYADAQALATRGVVEASRLGNIKTQIGYKAIAEDLYSLAHVLTDGLDRLGGATHVQGIEIEKAQALAERLSIAIGLKEQGPSAIAAFALLRQKAFTRHLRAYEEVRRALIYLRWHEGDVDTIAPSLYATGRSSSRRKSDKNETAPASEAPPPVAPAGAPASLDPSENPFIDG